MAGGEVSAPAIATMGARKAAIILIQLGKEKAASILGHLNETEVELISAEIARLEAVSADESESVLSEFRDLLTARAHVAQGGLGYAQQLLEQSLGADRASEIVERLNAAAVKMPFQFLHRADPSQVRTFIAEEHPQVIALVLAHMTPDKASIVIAGLAPHLQAEIAHRIAVMDRTSPEIIRSVEAALERKLSSVLQPSELSRVGGVDPLVNIINRSDRVTERAIVDGLENLDAELADEVRSRMFMFEDLVHLDDRSVQLVLRQTNDAELALALKGVSESVRNKITSNMSTRAAETLIEEVDLLGAVRLTQVEEALQCVIRTIRQLEEQGQIMVTRNNEEQMVV
jgi:flagellar motor switch protein FliG